MLADGDEVNGLKLPQGWTCVFTGNPEDSYNVSSLDDAQLSRTVLLKYHRPEEVFFRQLEVQQVDSKLKNLWVKDKAQCECPIPEIVRPKNNDRLKMIFARIHPMLALDDPALTMVVTNMFGIEWLSAYRVMDEEDQPPEPEVILNDYNSIRGDVMKMVEMCRTDIVSQTTYRLVAYITARKPEDFTADNWKNFEKFAEMLPESEIKRLVKSLSEYATAIGQATRVDGVNGSYTKRAAEIFREIDRRKAS